MTTIETDSAASPADLTASAAARALTTGTLTSEELVAACLARIDEREAEIRAWVYLDAHAAIEAARQCDRERVSASAGSLSPLHGIPIGVKDIFDTADMPTEYGSPLFAGHRPAHDAGVIADARAAGAIVLGKTVTTEFAYMRPGPTRNPRNPAHTPGGSSSGSAAAVAAGMVPLALGTQTGGSTIRPAAFCGIHAIMPTFGYVSWDGVRPLATALDTVGWFARSIEDLSLFGSVVHPGLAFDLSLEPDERPRIGVLRGPSWVAAGPEVQPAIEWAAASARSAGMDVTEVELHPDCDGLGEAWSTLIAVGAASAFAALSEARGPELSEPLRELIQRGRRATSAERSAAESTALACRVHLGELFKDFDALLTPASTGEAPGGLESTGDPVFNRDWTLLRLPCVALPVTTGPRGLPVGVQLVGRHGRDRHVLAVAHHLAAAIERF